jgi:hypothetical protein
MFIDHAQLHNGVVGQHGLLSHFGIDVTGDKAFDKVVAIGRRNSKNSSVSLASYTEDADRKRRKASVAATVWSELFAQPLFNVVRDAAVVCSRSTLSALLSDDTYTCAQQLPPGQNLSPTSPSDATNNDDGVRDIDISLGHQLMGAVGPTAACSYEPVPFGWPSGAFLHVSDEGTQSFVEVGTLMHLFIMNGTVALAPQ